MQENTRTITNMKYMQDKARTGNNTCNTHALQMQEMQEHAKLQMQRTKQL